LHSIFNFIINNNFFIMINRLSITEFCGKSVIDFSIQEGVSDLNKHLYRLKIEYDEDETVENLIRVFAEIPAAAEAQELIIGAWDVEYSSSSEGVVQALIAQKEVLKNLRLLFIGDIDRDEQEISWIQQCDLSPLLAAFPKLEFFGVRGGCDLRLSELKHENIRTLVIQTGGLEPDTVQDINKADLPNLENLELWLGSDNYGFDSKIKDFEDIINGTKFPKLTYLGLKNSIIQDEITIAITKSPLLNQLQTLDLSMGILTDIGGQALLDCPGIKNLKYLNLDFHYLSDKMMGKIKDLGINVSVEEQNVEEEEDRYVEVSE
jgi:hypothetical protein